VVVSQLKWEETIRSDSLLLLNVTKARAVAPIKKNESVVLSLC
jgi:hypothetical protein